MHSELEKKMMLLQSLLLYVLLLGSGGLESSKESTIQKLRHHLLTGYDIEARPVIHHLNTTVVEVGFKPIHISELNENTGILSLECLLLMTWHDSYLEWTPENFFGIRKIVFADREVWTPDLRFLNSIGSHAEPYHRTNVLVENTGNITWNPSASLQQICEIDYSQYPKDIQTCHIKIIPGVYKENNIELRLKKNDVPDNYESIVNPHWKILTVLKKKIGHAIEYQVLLQRQKVPFLFFCNLPDTAARFMILCMFWMPKETKKLLLGCTSLLLFVLIALCGTSSLPSAAAAHTALSENNTAMALCIAAIVVEVALLAITNYSEIIPSFQRYVAIVRKLNQRADNLGTTPDVPQDVPQETENSEPTYEKKSCWLPICLMERLAFVVFTILMFAL